MYRKEITELQWERLQALLAARKSRRGRPYDDDKATINGILWFLRTGDSWREMPKEYGIWQSAATRYYRWKRQGIWPEILDILQQTDSIDK